MTRHIPLIDRYVEAVKYWLPRHKSSAADELSKALYADLQVRKASSGKEVGNEEVGTMLQKSGPPLAVALRSQPGLSPLWRIYLSLAQGFVGLFLLPCVLLHWGNKRSEEVGSFLQPVNQMLIVGTSMFVLATLLFFIADSAGVLKRYLNNWRPELLPPLSTRHTIARRTSLAQFVMYTVLLCWWVSIPTGNAEDTTWWHFHGRLFLPILLYFTAWPPFTLFNLFHPVMTERRLGVHILLNGLLFGVSAVVVRDRFEPVRRLLDSDDPSMDWNQQPWPAEVWIYVAICCVCIGALLTVLWNVGRLARWRPPFEVTHQPMDL